MARVRGGCYLEPVAAVLSRKTGQAVKLAMTRTEVFEGTGPTSASRIRVKMGATRDGRLTAAEASLVYLSGAFPGSRFLGLPDHVRPLRNRQRLHRGV